MNGPSPLQAHVGQVLLAVFAVPVMRENVGVVDLARDFLHVDFLVSYMALEPQLSCLEVFDFSAPFSMQHAVAGRAVSKGNDSIDLAVLPEGPRGDVVATLL